jgi:hypothetical protein
VPVRLSIIRPQLRMLTRPCLEMIGGCCPTRPVGTGFHRGSGCQSLHSSSISCGTADGRTGGKNEHVQTRAQADAKGTVWQYEEGRQTEGRTGGNSETLKWQTGTATKAPWGLGYRFEP